MRVKLFDETVKTLGETLGHGVPSLPPAGARVAVA